MTDAVNQTRLNITHPLHELELQYSESEHPAPAATSLTLLRGGSAITGAYIT